MTRIFTEGFELGDLLFFSTISGMTAVTTGTPRSGSYHAKQTAGNAQTASKSVTAVSEAYFRFGFKYNGTDATVRIIFQWKAGATVLGSLRFQPSTGKFQIFVGGSQVGSNSTNTLSQNVYYLVELHIKIADASGTLEIKVEGTADSGCTFSGDTKPGADTTLDTIEFGMLTAGGFTPDIWYDDLAMNDTAGGADNSWPGDGRIIAILPNANGDVSQLAGSDGNSVDNYLLVDEVPSNGDTDYVSSGTAGQYDLYNIADFAPRLNHSVKRVWVECRAREETAAGDSISLGVKPSGGAEAWGTNRVVTTSYAAYVGDDLKVDPSDSLTWTEADLDALQIGAKVI